MKKMWIVSLLTAMVMITAAGCSSAASSDQTQRVITAPTVQTSVQESRTTQGITALYVSPDSCKLKISEKRLLTVRSDIRSELSSDLEWVCDDESIATVDSSGNVIGKAPGNCVITVFRRDQPAITAKVSITVKPNEESSSAQASTVAPAAQPSQVTSTAAPTQQASSAPSGSTTTIVYVTPPTGQSIYTVPQQYTYYYGRNNFSYSNPADGYVIHSMVGNYLYSSDVARMARHDAQMLINAIYAKHGYLFKDAEVRQFFETQDWYNSISIKTSSMKTISDRIASIDMDDHNLNLLLPIARS